METFQHIAFAVIPFNDLFFCQTTIFNFTLLSLLRARDTFCLLLVPFFYDGSWLDQILPSCRVCKESMFADLQTFL